MPLLVSDSFNLLAVNPGLVFWTVVTFTTVLFILWMFAWKPIIGALDARNEKVEKELQESHQLREEAVQLLKTYESKIERAKEEVLELVEKGKKEAENIGSQIVQKAEDESKKVRSRLEKEIEQAKISAVQEIQEGMVNLTIQIISKILKIDVEDETHRDLIVNELKKNTALK